MKHKHCRVIAAVIAGFIVNMGPGYAAPGPVDVSVPAFDPGIEGTRHLSRSSPEVQQIIFTLKRWASAWTDQKVSVYLSFYGKQFHPVDGMPIQEWTALRQARILAPKQLEVLLGSFTVTASNADKIAIEFMQAYRSDVHQDRVLKEMILVQTGSEWLIQSERILQVVESVAQEHELVPQQDGWEKLQGQFRSYGLAGPAAQEWDEVVSESPLNLKGFWDNRLGFRTQKDPNEKSLSIAETRLQLEFEKTWEDATSTLVVDLLYDYALDEHGVHLEDGSGWLDLREANIVLSPADFLDEKVGRQILTWGTGDLIFINDLFPKDWVAFFTGRDEAYLKAPSDAFKFAFYHDLVNIDFVYTPRFDADRLISGRRISFFNPAAGTRTGRNAVVKLDQPDAWFKDDEIAVRIHRVVKSYELAAYGYDGFWKSPGGVNPVTGKATFPALSVVGASARGVLWDGVANVELGYYNSNDDSDGSDPFIRNSEFRALLGYEREIAKELTLGLQYYLERMQHHKRYLRSLPTGSAAADKNRSVVTSRLTKFLLNQNLQLSLFAYLSPSDQDGYVRPRAKYKVDDSWTVEAGGNVFFGRSEHTFFNQFEDNSNLYGSVRFSF